MFNDEFEAIRALRQEYLTGYTHGRRDAYKLARSTFQSNLVEFQDFTVPMFLTFLEAALMQAEADDKNEGRFYE